MHGVLIVDDEALVREAIISLANWSDFDVETILEAADAIRALEIVRTHPEIDIVLTDMKMPEMDGAEFLREMKRLGLEKAIVAISGYSDYEYTRQAVQSGLIDYILKPIAPEDLNCALAEAASFLERKTDTVGGPPVWGEDVPRAAVDDIISYIDVHFLENLSLQALADMFAMSREHLSRHFKRTMGTNLFEYIAGKKMETARNLLAQTDAAIKSIAYELGYRDEHYFSKMFRRTQDMSPTEYRNRERHSTDIS